MKFDNIPEWDWRNLKTKDPVDYKNYDSLFEFCKATSNYHFDETRDDTVGEVPTHIPVCEFEGDWEQETAELIQSTTPATFNYRSDIRMDNNNKLEYNDFKKWGYDIDSDENSYAVLNRYMQKDFPRVFKKMAKLFCFDHPAGKKNGRPNIKFDVQIPGQMFYWHLDNFGGLLQSQREDYNKFAACDYDQRLIMRVIIFLDNQKQGQVWKQGNNFLTWKKGDCFTWPWRDIPHGTANFGHDPRPTLNITGEVTEETYEFLKTCPRRINV
tara:strand:- start:1085 stop:1891 length:807 start_codon:yes stop_codon:yes gene_type:complete